MIPSDVVVNAPDVKVIRVTHSEVVVVNALDVKAKLVTPTLKLQL